MTKDRFARFWYGLIALQVMIVIPIRLVRSWNDIYGDFSEGWARSVNVLCYFTNQSNILVGVISALLVFNLKRSSFRFVVAQFTALICIVVAGVVYYLLLASEDNLVGIDAITNFVVHTSVPIMFVIGWLAFIDRGQTTMKTVRYSLIFPICWAIFAMVRGAIIDWYPYPFMDVRDLGYAMALLNMSVVTLFFLLLYFLAHLLDKKLSKERLSV